MFRKYSRDAYSTNLINVIQITISLFLMFYSDFLTCRHIHYNFMLFD